MASGIAGENRWGAPGSLHTRRAVTWLVLSILAALVAYFGVRGYLNPELLFHFANALYC